MIIVCLCFFNQNTAYDMRISDCSSDLCSSDLRVAVVPGKISIGIELPNARRETVYLRELLASDAYDRSAHKLALMLGKDIGGTPVIADLARMPHLLVAGTTGSGKSVAVNTMILSLLYRSEEHTSELQSLMRISYAVFCLKKKK